MICPKIRPTIALKVLLATLCLTPFIHLPICQTQVKRSEWPALTISLPCAARRSPVCARVPVCPCAGVLGRLLSKVAAGRACARGATRWPLSWSSPTGARSQVTSSGTKTTPSFQVIDLNAAPLWELRKREEERDGEGWWQLWSVTWTRGLRWAAGWTMVGRFCERESWLRSSCGWGRGGENGLEAVGGPALKVISLMPCSYDCFPTFDCWQWTEGLLHIEWVSEGGGVEGLRQSKKGWREGYVYSGHILPLIRLV